MGDNWRYASLRRLMVSISALALTGVTCSANAADFTIATDSTTAQTLDSGGNTGTINAGATLAVDGDAITGDADNVTINNNGTVSATGVTVNADKDDVTVTNTGTMSSSGDRVIELDDDGVITNSGTITATAANGKDAIKTDKDVTITNNAGATISGTDEGVQIDSGTVTNNGTITGYDNGVSGDESSRTITVDNSGTITGTTDTGIAGDGGGTVTNNSGGVIQGLGDDGIDFDSDATITNNGTIKAAGGDNANDSSEGVSMGGGTLTNNAGAAITSDDNGVYFAISASSDRDQTSAGTVTNAGTITATRGVGVKFWGDATIDEDPETTGMQASTDWNDTLTNTGTIFGGGGTAIDMGGGDDTVNVNGGSITGDILGGNGTDALSFDVGAGNSFSFSDDITGFETTTVTSGTVSLTGGFASTTSVTVANGATLNSAASFTTGTLSVNGTFQGNLAGSSSRTVTATTFTQAATGTYAPVIHGSTADTVTATDATLAGTLQPKVGSSGYVPDGQTYDVVTSTNAKTGTFTTLGTDDGSALIDFTVDQTDANRVRLTATRTQSYSSAASSGAAKAVGAALEAAGQGGASGDMATILGALDSMGTTAEVEAALKDMAPPADNAPIEAAVGTQNRALETLDNRLGVLRRAQQASGTAATAITGLAGGGGGDDPIGVWTQVFGSYQEQDAKGNAAGYNSQTVGAAFGADTRLTDSMTFGVAAAYGRTAVDSTDSRDGDTLNLNSYQGAVYGSWEHGPTYVDGMVAAAYNDYESERKVTVGTIERVAHGAYDGAQVSVKGEGGHSFFFDGLQVTPNASLQYTHLYMDDYTETGAGAVNLSVDERSVNLLEMGIGTDLAMDFTLDDNLLIRPELRATYLYEMLGEGGGETTARFSGGGGSFSTDSSDPSQHGVALGTGVTMVSTFGLTASVNYDAELRDGFLGHYGRLDLRMDF